MAFRIWALGGTLAVIALGAFAHSGVKNPVVMTRMNAMSDVAAAMKVMGDMAKGQTAFDAAAVDQALGVIVAKAADVPTLFEAEAQDPKSEALPAIWQNFPDFSAKAADMGDAAAAVRGKAQSAADLGAALQALGATCKACHKPYRK